MKHIKEYISVNERISSIDDYIIEEWIKDKIKSLWKKIKKEKVPEKVWAEDDLLKYKDKEITEKEALELAKIYIKVNHATVRLDDFEKRAFAQGILDYAWQNDKKDKLTRIDPFGDEYAKGGYLRANKESGYEYDDIGVGMCFLEPFHLGWGCSEKLNLKYTTKEQPKINLKRD